MRLAWDPVGPEFARRHTQYEVFYNRASHVPLNRMEHVGDYDDLVSGRQSDDAGGGRRIALTASA